MRRLSRAGYKQEFVRSAILPDWWEDGCARDPSLLDDIELRVARFLGASLSLIRDPRASLSLPSYAGARLRHVRDVSPARLSPAIHAGMRIAAAAVRSLRDPEPIPKTPPTDGLHWRAAVKHPTKAVTLEDLLNDLWLRGIPVVPLETVPAPSFQGMACVIGGHPVILIGYKHDEPGRVAFLVAHEVGHITRGDCEPEQPVVEAEEILDHSNSEVKADQYAARVLVGADSVPKLDGGDFKVIATRAAQLERDTGADAGAIIWGWAARTGNYQTATMACKALYRASGARRRLRQHFDRHVDIEAAAESDRDLLRCVIGDSD